MIFMRRRIKINKLIDKFKNVYKSIDKRNKENNKRKSIKEPSNEETILELKKYYNKENILTNNKKHVLNEENSFNFRDNEDFLLKKDKSKINNKRKSLNISKENKTVVGGVVFGFIIIALIFSAYFFFIYSPFSEELRAAKIEKLNELNSLYKGPLAVNNEVNSLRSEINNAKSPEEVKLIDILQPATNAWREYHNHQINNIKDEYGRVMIKYLNNSSKSILLSVDDASSFVNTNDATILSKLNFIKPDTIIVPVSLSRLQAGGGLISVGSFVDIYFSSNENYNGNNPSTINNESEIENKDGRNNEEISANGNKTGNDSSNFQYSSYNSQILYDNENPSVIGAVVIAIMRSKSSGVVDGNYMKSEKSMHDNLSNIIENEESFSTDVEEILKSVAAGGFNDEILAKFLNNFGSKLSDYERVANIAELDSQYLVLLEIPRNDVHLLINNMNNMKITIPTNKAPNWALNELKNKYSD
jgi:hypothetical protein